MHLFKYFLMGLMTVISPIWSLAKEAPRDASAASFYVATNGNDQWSGTLSEPNAQKTDGPFANLERARQAVRQLKADPAKNAAPIVVQVRGGIYFLDKALTFEPADSGTEKAPVIYEAYPGEKPVISGGNRVGGWRLVNKNRWETQIPDVASGQWNFSQLYVNDERRVRPVMPKNGYYYIAGELAATSGTIPDRFTYRSGQFDPNWKNLTDIEVRLFHRWTMYRMRPKAIDSANRIVTFTSPARNRERTPLSRTTWYQIENVGEALSDPGEWYLNRKEGTLTYLAKPGEDLSKAEVIAPRLPYVIRMAGDPLKQEFVENIILRGLTVEHAAWNASEKGFSWHQADVGVNGAVTARGIKNCAFERISVRNVGNHAIELTEGCFQNRIEGCKLVDLGAGGIKVGPTQNGSAPDEKLWCNNTVIRDNLIAHGGRVQPGGVGIWLGHGNYQIVEHNRIADFYYSGISVGWSFHILPSSAHHNMIAYNYITDIGQGVLSDLGGIYTTGLQPGTVVAGNVINNVSYARYGGNGIYLDAASSEILVENNLVTHCQDCCIHQNYGRDNTVRNNIFAFGEEGQIRVGNQDKSAGVLNYEQNIFYWKDSYLMFGRDLTEKNRFSKNIYWEQGKQTPSWFRIRNQQREWTKFNQEPLVADPKFVAPEQGDFRFQADSPVMKFGFRPFDTSKAGRLTKDDDEKYLKAPPRAFPPAPSEPTLGSNQDFSVDFEKLLPGEFPEEFIQQDMGAIDAGATSKVAAPGGKMSFKISNGLANSRDKGLMQIGVRPQMDSGKTVNSFDLYLEPKARVRMNWLDGDNALHSTAAGPILIIDSEGALSANSKKLLNLPYNQWIHIEVVCSLGKTANGQYSVSVSIPGQGASQQFEQIACDTGFKSLHWLGIATVEDGPDAYYIDNFKLLHK